MVTRATYKLPAPRRNDHAADVLDAILKLARLIGHDEVIREAQKAKAEGLDFSIGLAIGIQQPKTKGPSP